MKFTRYAVGTKEFSLFIIFLFIQKETQPLGSGSSKYLPVIHSESSSSFSVKFVDFSISFKKSKNDLIKSSKFIVFLDILPIQESEQS